MRYAEYALHYRKTIGDIRIEFYRGFNGGVPSIKEKEIGNVLTNLSFQIQGEQGDIDTPIVKTSLAISMNDASDLTDGNMNGSWDFFAQGTETEWMVQICREDDDLILWSGFVTPDSYSEELRYRGVCSIIARDNIGQLQNYDFDAAGNADGLISLVNLVSAAWSKVGNGMRLTWASDAMWLSTDLGTPARYTMMNVSAFEEMSWYEALESALYAYGAVLRYAGNNTFVVCPIKWLPTLGQMYDNVTWQNPTLMAGASLEYAPAAKKIEEEVKYEIAEDEAKRISSDDFTGATERYSLKDNTAAFEGIAMPIKNTSIGNGWCNPQDSLFFNPSSYTMARKNQDKEEYMWLACNNWIADDNSTFLGRYAEYSKEMWANNISFFIKFGSPYAFDTVGRLIQYNAITSCTFAIIVEQDGFKYYYDNKGGWDTIPYKFKIENGGDVEIPLNLETFVGKVVLRVQIQQVETTTDKYVGQRFVPITSAGFSSNKPLRSVNRVNTNYIERNNLILTRSPKLGSSFDSVAIPSFIKNGIFDIYDGRVEPTPKWVIAYDYDNDVEVVSQLAAGIHMQILPYFTKPNRVINATILNKNLIDDNPLYVWEGREYLLMSGTYNLLNGNIDGAVLREFARYTDVWQGATLPDIKEESTKN